MATWCRRATAGRRSLRRAVEDRRRLDVGRGVAVSKSDFATYAFALLALPTRRRERCAAPSSCISPMTRKSAASSGRAGCSSKGLSRPDYRHRRRLLLCRGQRPQRLPASRGRRDRPLGPRREAGYRASTRWRRRRRSSPRSTHGAPRLAARRRTPRHRRAAR